MIAPDETELKALAHVAQNVPALVAWVAQNYTTELERLPKTAADSQALASGRCQVLQELYKLLTEAPEMVA